MFTEVSRFQQKTLPQVTIVLTSAEIEVLRVIDRYGNPVIPELEVTVERFYHVDYEIDSTDGTVHLGEDREPRDRIEFVKLLLDYHVCIAEH